MAQIVKADTLHLVCDQKIREMLAQKVGANPLAHRVHIDIVEIIRTVGFSTNLPIQLLLFHHLLKHMLTGRDQRKGAATGLCFSSVSCDFRYRSVDLCGHNRMLNADFLVLKVNGIPFQTNNFTAPQPVECSHDDAKLRRVTLNHLEKLLQFFTAVNLRLELFLTRTFNAICRVGTDHADLKSIL